LSVCLFAISVYLCLYMYHVRSSVVCLLCPFFCLYVCYISLCASLSAMSVCLPVCPVYL
jgi:hypothetical protein